MASSSDTVWDLDSDLSEPTSDFDDVTASSINEDLMHTPLNASARSKRDADSLQASHDDNERSAKRLRTPQGSLSRLEDLPTEILNRIASELPNDVDLFRLIRASPAFCEALNPNTSAIWRARFLVKWDHPFVRNNKYFAIVYRERGCILNQFVEFTNENETRLIYQLEHLTCMILEAYHQPDKHLPPPLKSLNLEAFDLPKDSPWMKSFLTNTFYPKTLSRGQNKYGQSHALFDAIQVALSHLVLSPASEMAQAVQSSRHRYDMALVYNWSGPLAMICHRVPSVEAPPTPAHGPSGFSNLTRRDQGPKYEVDTYALLHVRNFFHRHLIESDYGSLEAHSSMNERTYASMANLLCDAGIAPRPWDQMLVRGLPLIANEWYGHYSCIHPWPKRRQDLEIVQTDAEDWSSAHPLKLDIVIAKKNDLGFWPPIFRDIPIFNETIPEALESSISFRGVAPFVDLHVMDSVRNSTSKATLTLPGLPKYHPYTSLRVRGVVHPIGNLPRQDQVENPRTTIPGWSRVVMIMYKPTTDMQIAVLERAEQNLSGFFGSALNSLMNQNGQPLLGLQQLAAANLDPEELELARKRIVEEKLSRNPAWRHPENMDKHVIAEMEERFKRSEHMEWTDMDYAYAYEGIVLPGGKIMMGRWWRCGINGASSPGYEVDEQGAGPDNPDQSDEESDSEAEIDHGDDDDDPMDVDGGGAKSHDGLGSSSATTSARAKPARKRFPKLERGPFVFWC
ncbi:uncharacterized protein PV06_05681 [Exophiala oligosperma]|uniref:F-box domain-containing protein n=1 Tax=Exophiala oligosperma TaxID=215243 RepID=A0A0D2BX75_9EURO|nr:uncharacterized protein PV06_05681 [Exophiala oligosperma]KIW42097.1 hypothetical protein PV06_05681 [Exophiala oligosperma]